MTCKAISNVCSNFFSPYKPISPRFDICIRCPGYWTAAKVGAYCTVVLPLLFAAAWGGAKLCDYLFTEVPVETQLQNQGFDAFIKSKQQNTRYFALNGCSLLIVFNPNGNATFRAKRPINGRGVTIAGNVEGKFVVISRDLETSPTIQKLGAHLTEKHEKPHFYHVEGSVQLINFEGVENFS